ncbi:Zinc finger protein CONSTANS-LIKE 7 [Acorus calamus]|uniref:Zinc finger protein CONSTANS-LIKE 7 n=1 Tax=Acorus calamus TaxID=4465 RepID=A0AAV9C3E4_ACOCL|nr:Zinc finger protein CONSTANS-LIKE 7 [Acorus calamus]
MGYYNLPLRCLKEEPFMPAEVARDNKGDITTEFDDGVVGDRGSLWATNDSFAVEVPVMEEEKKRRRDRVLRYREKRRSRLFFKRIRYQVRKLNAEQRPRSKGRFVKTIT